MREKVSTAYFLDDPRKFSSMEEAEKELNRLRAVCVRLKKKRFSPMPVHFVNGGF